MQILITPKLKDEVDLYCDNGLAVCSATPKLKEKTKEEICKVFKANSLSITIGDPNPNNTNNNWKAIRHCIPNKSTSQQIFSKNNKTVADEFNQFFVSVGKSTVNKIT